MKQLVQWGAGNIGRSFIGQIFGRGGCRVVFVDVNEALVKALAEAGRYEVLFLSNEGEERIAVEGVDAVTAGDTDALFDSVLKADYLSFSVGKNILPKAAARAAQAIAHRYALRPETPLDIIIAENIHGGAAFLRELLLRELPDGFPLERYLGFVETSLGKMVPIQSGDDPLVVCAEPFNTLIMDRNGFLGEPPDYPGVRLVEPIGAYVAEKLYIHNLGHAAAAYLGYAEAPEARFIWQLMELPPVRAQARRAMEQAGAVLRAEFPGVFAAREIDDHIGDLLSRFANRALGDTVHRVGRDLRRKLNRDDRLMGAILAAQRHGLPWDAIGNAFLKGLSFLAPDEQGSPLPADIAFLEELSALADAEKIARAAGFSPEEAERYRDPVIAKLAKLTRPA